MAQQYNRRAVLEVDANSLQELFPEMLGIFDRLVRNCCVRGKREVKVWMSIPQRIPIKQILENLPKPRITFITTFGEDMPLDFTSEDYVITITNSARKFRQMVEELTQLGPQLRVHVFVGRINSAIKEAMTALVGSKGTLLHYDSPMKEAVEREPANETPQAIPGGQHEEGRKRVREHAV